MLSFDYHIAVSDVAPGSGVKKWRGMGCECSHNWLWVIDMGTCETEVGIETYHHCVLAISLSATWHLGPVLYRSA